jgi:hypothetical protein
MLILKNYFKWKGVAGTGKYMRIARPDLLEKRAEVPACRGFSVFAFLLGSAVGAWKLGNYCPSVNKKLFFRVECFSGVFFATQSEFVR